MAVNPWMNTNRLDDGNTVQPVTWQPEAPPDLYAKGIKELELDFETNGLHWWDKDRPIGAAVRYPDGIRKYYPWGHKGGGNLDEGVVKRWFHEQWKHVSITNLNSRFDNHMAYAWGVDFEAQGCRWSDVGHYAALLDDHRQTFSLESISQDFLGYGKLDDGLDKTKMADYPAWRVAAYAEQDVHLVGELKKILLPKLAEEELMRVKALEDALIYVVCEMERNGALIDWDLLEKWRKQAEQDYERCLWQLEKLVAFNKQPNLPGIESNATFNPNSNEHWRTLFKARHIPFKDFSEGGKPSFTDEVLKRIDDDAVKLGRRAKQLASLKSKYLDKMWNARFGDKLLYALHQLKAQKDEWAEQGEAGTVSGRFSSTEIAPGVGVNQQQVMKTAKQRIKFGFEEDDASHDHEIYPIRQLYIPAPGHEFFSADAMQIEYRLFAHHANSKRINAIYEKDPLASFHKETWAMMKPYCSLSYRGQKDMNFAKIYAAGMKKLAWMAGFITKAQFEYLRDTDAPNDHPLLAGVREVLRIYDRELPEVKPLLQKASHLAKTHCDKWCKPDDWLHKSWPHKGFVTTLLKRRSRFPHQTRLHKALNAVIQGSAADIMKVKLLEVHAARKKTGFIMRWTVHDELDGCTPGKECTEQLTQILNRQSFPELRIPILWDVSTGANWKECA